LGGDRGQGSGVPSPWWCGEDVEPSELFAEQPERGWRRSLPEQRKGGGAGAIELGRGGEEWSRPVRGKEELGTALL
jgi:hypothetical protein